MIAGGGIPGDVSVSADVCVERGGAQVFLRPACRERSAP
jgi:hypothetical protein